MKKEGVWGNPFVDSINKNKEEDKDIINPLNEKKRILKAEDKMSKKPSGLLEKKNEKKKTDDGREIL